MAGYNDNIPTIKRGPIYSKGFDTDGSLWIPFSGGAGGVFSFVGNFTNTRNATGDYQLALTPAANSSFVVVDISQIFDKVGSDPIFGSPGMPFPSGTTNFPGNITNVGETLDSSGHLIRGIQLTAYDTVYTLGTANLTTHTGTLVQASHGTGAASPVVITKMAVAPLGIVTSANIIITKTTVTTPYVIGNNASVAGGPDIADWLEIAIVNPGTSVLKYYGVRLYFNYCLL